MSCLPLATRFFETNVFTAREVGLLPVVTELVLTAAMFAFLAAFVFFLARGNSVHPAHRPSGALTAVTCLVAGLAYWYIRYFYHDMMQALAARANDPVGQQNLVRDAFFAISPYRYMAWIVTTPLLLLKTVLLLKVKPREIFGWIALLLGADVWMVLASCIGDQQIGPDGMLLVGKHALWGALAMVGSLVIPYVLLIRLAPRYGGRSDDESGRAFRMLAFATVTTWGVYPLGSLATGIFPKLDLNWIHLAYTVADLVHIIGLGVVAYLAGAEELARRCPPEAVQSARIST